VFLKTRQHITRFQVHDGILFHLSSLCSLPSIRSGRYAVRDYRSRARHGGPSAPPNPHRTSALRSLNTMILPTIETVKLVAPALRLSSIRHAPDPRLRLGKVGHLRALDLWDMGTPGSPPTRLTAIPDKWVRPTKKTCWPVSGPNRPSWRPTRPPEDFLEDSPDDLVHHDLKTWRTRQRPRWISPKANRRDMARCVM
jgi:hypothetical protein